MSEHDDKPDWRLATWEGSRREQLRRWRKLTLRERFEAREGMAEVGKTFAEARDRGKLRTP